MTNFDEQAKDWDTDPMKVERAKSVADTIRKVAPLSPEMTALEYGCGTGLLSFALQEEFGQITLADASQGMLDILKEKIAASGARNMTPLRLDLTTDPLPTERYNLIYSLMTLHHIRDTRDILEKFNALLEPGGYLILVDLEKEDGSFHTDGATDIHKGFALNELQQQAEAGGFVGVRFYQTYEIKKKIGDVEKSFPLFLMIARKKRAPQIMNGKLEAYWEQGWEGMVLFSFMPEGGKGLDDLIPLQNGQRLTIYDTNGKTLWSGAINLVRRNEWRDRHKLDAGIWSDLKQKDVSYADWMDWFWRTPPLKARLEFKGDASEQPKPREQKTMNKPTNDHPNINTNVHPPIVAIFYIIVALLLGRFVPALSGMSPLLKNIGLGLTFVGFLLGVGAFIEFRKARTTLDPHGSVKALVTGGIYRFTRNPIYLGFFLMVVGFPLAYGTLWGLVAAPFYGTTMSRLVIEKEEAYLEKKFKEQYTGYRSRVRRWI